MAPRKLRKLKIKTSLTLSEEAISSLDEQAEELKISRSRLMEALAKYGKLSDSVKKQITEF